MSAEQFKAFLEAAEVDTALQEKLIAAGMDPDAVSAIAKEAGFLISVEELTGLSDKELEKVAGGTPLDHVLDFLKKMEEEGRRIAEEIEKRTKGG